MPPGRPGFIDKSGDLLSQHVVNRQSHMRLFRQGKTDLSGRVERIRVVLQEQKISGDILTVRLDGCRSRIDGTDLQVNVDSP